MLHDLNSEVFVKKVSQNGIIVLNKNKSLNALSHAMAIKIYDQIQAWSNDDQIKMIIIKSALEKAFCSGGDVKEIFQMKISNTPIQKAMDFFSREYSLNYLISTISKPYITILNGIVMGAGVGLSIHGSYRIATEKAVFAMPETVIGHFPDIGGSYFLPRFPEKLGLFLGLTGSRLFGFQLLEVGVATHFVHSSKIQQLIDQLEKLENTNHEKVEEVLKKYSNEKTFLEASKLNSIKSYLENINKTFGKANSVEEIIFNLKQDNSDWSKKQLAILNKVSPTSLKVTFKAYQKGAKMSLIDCLKMEYRIVGWMYQGQDFFEGIRALLIDKDQNPKWQPSTLEEVTDEKVYQFFESLENLDLKELPIGNCKL